MVNTQRYSFNRLAYGKEKHIHVDLYNRYKFGEMKNINSYNSYRYGEMKIINSYNSYRYGENR